MKKKVLNYFKICLIWFLVFTCLEFILYGIPLIGLPQQEDILCATITNKNTNEIVVVNDGEKLEQARNAGNILKLKLGPAEKEAPKYEIVYELKNHKKVTISANEKTVYFNDKALPIRGNNGKFFMTAVEVCFF